MALAVALLLLGALASSQASGPIVRGDLGFAEELYRVGAGKGHAPKRSRSLYAETLRPMPKNLRLPPDGLAPFPPAPPALQVLNVGPINSIVDVCKVCTQVAYSSNCTSKFATRCMSAMRQYLLNLFGLRDNYCSCYQAVANQLFTMSCPNIPFATLWVGNCDPFCFYGPACPVNTVLYSILKPGYMDLANRVDGPGYKNPAALKGSAAVIIELRAQLGRKNATCFKILNTTDLPAPIYQAEIRQGILGQSGPAAAFLFRGVDAMRYDGCVATRGDVLQGIAYHPTRYYMDIDTMGGSVRGQLLASPHLMSYSTDAKLGNNKGKACGGFSGGCTAFIDLTLTVATMSYVINYVPAAPKDILAANIAPLDGSGPPLVNLFGPQIAAVSNANALQVSITQTLQLLAWSSSYAINISTSRFNTGAYLGQLYDSMSVNSTLSSDQVVVSLTGQQKPSGSATKGKAYFTAQIGAGGICYQFAFKGVYAKPIFAYIQVGPKGSYGPPFFFTTLNVTNPTVTCLEADTAVTGAILSNPAKYHVQVYASAKKDMTQPIMRGQLSISPQQAL